VPEKPQTISLDSALGLLANSDTRILAGGTDYYPGLNDAAPDDQLLNIRGIAGLDQIEKLDDHWRIGAAVTWTQLINASLPVGFNALKLAAREVGSVQIQNAATLVGNICNASPAADGVPALLVLDAQVELQSSTARRLVPLADFLLGVRSTCLQQNEMVTALLIPHSVSDDQTDFVKLGARTYLVISIVMCAARLRVNAENKITDAAIAVGACSAVACRLTSLEQSLIGKACSAEGLANCVTEEHLALLAPIDDVRATATYRYHASKVMLQRQLLGFVKPSVTEA